jgi:hypothetical protein
MIPPVRRIAATCLIAAAVATTTLIATGCGQSNVASSGETGATRAAPTRIAPNGLAYSIAGAYVIQPQPPAGACHARGSGLYSEPDLHCTPGALDPAVTQATIDSTICRRGWTATVRPPESITEPEKLASMAAYGVGGSASAYEYDHDVPLELGGAVNDPQNLWPEPDYATPSAFYLNPKDHLEQALNRLVCDGRMSLSYAQRAIATDWVAAYRRYG